MTTLLETENLTLRIGQRTLLKALSIACRSGELWGVLGPNGSGKTTLLLTLAGIRQPHQGRVLLEQQAMASYPRRQIARRLGMLQQHLPRTTSASVMEMALMGRHPHLSPWSMERPGDRRLALQALRQVDLEELGERLVKTLSGGEARRLAFATLLVQNPRIMLLDEPTNHLDLRHQLQLLAEVRQRVSGGGLGVMATHDINLAARCCSHLVLIYSDGECEAGATAELLNEARLSRLYQCPVRAHRSARGDWYAPDPDWPHAATDNDDPDAIPARPRSQ